MAPSYNVPEELVESVLSNLDRKADQRTILTLRLVNKTFHRLTKDLVWIVMDTRSNKKLFVPQNDQKRTTVKTGKAIEMSELQRWIEDLAERPNLANLVKEGIFGHPPPSESTSVGCRSKESRFLVALGNKNLLSYVRRFETPSPERPSSRSDMSILQDIASGRTSFLLASCDELEVLQFDFGFEALRDDITRFLEFVTNRHFQGSLNGLKPLTTLSNVKSVCLKENGRYQTSMADALNLLCLPQLQSLHISGLSDNPLGSRNQQLPPMDHRFRNRQPNLKLYFDSCTFSGEGLSRLLAACDSPHSLTARWRGGLWTEHMVNKPVGDAIRQYGTKLEYIHLDSTPCWEGIGKIRDRPEDSFGTFKHVNAKTFAIPRATVAIAFDNPKRFTKTMRAILPSNLETLYILGIEDQDERDLLLSLTSEPTLQNLKEVYCVPWMQYIFEEWFGQIHSACIDYDSLEILDLRNIYERDKTSYGNVSSMDSWKSSRP